MVAEPLSTVTYCRPLRSHAIGRPLMPEPIWNDHSRLPLAASKAMNWPLCEPVKTRPPAVDSTPDQKGDLLSTRQTALPVTGSQATSEPRLPSSGETKPPSSRPRYQLG